MHAADSLMNSSETTPCLSSMALFDKLEQELHTMQRELRSEVRQSAQRLVHLRTTLTSQRLPPPPLMQSQTDREGSPDTREDVEARTHRLYTGAAVQQVKLHVRRLWRELIEPWFAEVVVAGFYVPMLERITRYQARVDRLERNLRGRYVIARTKVNQSGVIMTPALVKAISTFPLERGLAEETQTEGFPSDSPGAEMAPHCLQRVFCSRGRSLSHILHLTCRVLPEVVASQRADALRSWGVCYQLAEARAGNEAATAAASTHEAASTSAPERLLTMLVPLISAPASSTWTSQRTDPSTTCGDDDVTCGEMDAPMTYAQHFSQVTVTLGGLLADLQQRAAFLNAPVPSDESRQRDAARIMLAPAQSAATLLSSLQAAMTIATPLAPSSLTENASAPADSCGFVTCSEDNNNSEATCDSVRDAVALLSHQGSATDAHIDRVLATPPVPLFSGFLLLPDMLRLLAPPPPALNSRSSLPALGCAGRRQPEVVVRLLCDYERSLRQVVTRTTLSWLASSPHTDSSNAICGSGQDLLALDSRKTTRDKGHDDHPHLSAEFRGGAELPMLALGWLQEAHLRHQMQSREHTGSVTGSAHDDTPHPDAGQHESAVSTPVRQHPTAAAAAAMGTKCDTELTSTVRQPCSSREAFLAWLRQYVGITEDAASAALPPGSEHAVVALYRTCPLLYLLERQVP